MLMKLGASIGVDVFDDVGLKKEEDDFVMMKLSNFASVHRKVSYLAVKGGATMSGCGVADDGARTVSRLAGGTRGGEVVRLGRDGVGGNFRRIEKMRGLWSLMDKLLPQFPCKGANGWGGELVWSRHYRKHPTSL